MPIPANILTELADVLAEIYSDHASARTMATTAGVPVEHIPVDDKPLGYWVNILQEAENRGLTEALLDRAAVQYPNNPALAAARQAYAAGSLPPLPALDLPENPYRYLDWYRREDAEVFFGREREIRALLDRVSAADGPPIILLYGQSGVGKSSLLAAGLLPRLEGAHTVRYARRDQGKGLRGTLAAALGASSEADPRQTWHRLEEASGQPVLLILDQVEEVYTRPNRQQPNELADFLEALEGLFADTGDRPRGRLILSFRKEWLAEITTRLSERSVPRGQVFIERLGRAGIAGVVAGPQSRERLRAHFGLEVATALTGLIADDLLADRESPVAPMLAILLTGMWDAAKKRSYDHPVFDEDLYHEFRSRGLSLDDFLSRQLTALRSEMPEVVDAGLALDLLAYHTTPLGTAEQHTLTDLEETYRHRLDVLPGLVVQCQRLYLLVDPSQNQPDQPPASRLTHDTLAPHVRKRFDESDAPGQRARRILESRAVDWEEGKEGAPLDDADLTLVEAGEKGMRARHPDEARLVQASVAARDQRLEEQNRIKLERAEAQQRELNQAQELAETQRLRAEEGEKAARRLRWRLILATVAGTIALVLGVIAIRLAMQSQYEARRARAGELALSAQVELAQPVPDYSLALLLAQESISLTQRAGDPMNLASYRALAESVNGAPLMRLALPPHQHAGAITSIAFSPQCLRPAPAAGQPCPRALLTAGVDETARLWDPETLEQLAQFIGHDGAVSSALFSPDGSRVLTVGLADATVRVWSAAEGGRQLQALMPPGETLAAGFTADSRNVVTVERGSITRVWDVAAEREKRQIEAAAGARFAAISPDGELLAVVTDRDAASVQLVELNSGTVRRALPINQDIVGLTFTNDGKQIAVHSMAFSASRDTMWDEMALWDVGNGRRIERIRPGDPIPLGNYWLPNGTQVRFDEDPAGTEEPWQGITLFTGSDPFMTHLTATTADPAGGFVAAGGDSGDLYVWRLPITRPIAAVGQTEGLTALAFGDGDRQVLIGGLDGRLSRWDAITGNQQLLKPFGREIDTWVTQAALSADGSLAAAMTQGIGLGVWDARSGQLLEGTKFRESYPDSPDIIRFVPGGAGLLNPNTGTPGLLVYGRDTQRVHLYDPRSDTIQATFKGECESPTQMVVSRDGTTLAMDCAGQGIMVWQGNPNVPVTLPLPTADTKIKALYAGGRNGSLRLLDEEGRIFNLDTKTNRWTPAGDAGIGKVYAATFSPDGRQLSAALAGGVISLVDASGVTVQTWRHGSAESVTAGVTALAFSDDGLTLATADEDGRARLWDVSPGARYRLMSSERPVALPASYCAQPSKGECRTVVAALQNARLSTWETSASSALALDQIPISRTLRISPDGRHAMVQAANKQLCVWATETAQEIGCLPDNIRTMAIGGSEPTLATLDGSDLRLWRLPGFDLERSIPVSAEQVSLVALSPAAPILAVVEAKTEVKLWVVSGGEAKLLRSLSSPLGNISQLTFSPDGGVLWMASGGPTASVISRWQVATGQELPAQRLRVDTGVAALAVSPMGDRLAAGGADGMIYLWDAATGAEIGRLNAGGVTALAFNSDGRVLFSAEERYPAFRIWPLDLKELLAQAATRIARDPPQLTGAERRRYGLK